MKRKPAKKRPVKKADKTLAEANARAESLARDLKIKVRSLGDYANAFEDSEKARKAAEQKAARLEEQVAKQIDEKAQFARTLVQWQDTVKLRDEAIDRKQDRIKEQLEQIQQLTSQVTELTGMQEGLAPNNLQYGKVLEAEVEARKQVEAELGVAKRDLHQWDLALKKAAADRDLLANDLKAMGTWRDKLQEELDQTRAAKMMWENRADVLAEELARHKTPAQPAPETKPYFAMTISDLAEFTRLFGPRES